METKLIVCHARPGDAYEIQTDETPHRLVAALFHNGNDPGRLSIEEAAVYASIFAAAPELLEACQLTIKHAEHEVGCSRAINIEASCECYLHTVRAAIAKTKGQE